MRKQRFNNNNRNNDNGNELIARVYIRVSMIGGRGDGTGHDLLSPETQLEAGRTLAKANGWILDEEASLKNTDLDESAFRQSWDKRKGLVAHLEDARKGKYQILIAYKLGRLARNAREGLVLCDLFEQAGVGVYTQVEGIDPNTVIGRMQRTMMFGIAEMQSENISEDVTANFATRVRSGKPHGRPPAWVRKDPITGALSLDPTGAASLRRLVELRTVPTSYSMTARILNAEGHRRPIEQHAETRGDQRELWNANAVYKSLEKHRRFLMRGHFEYLRNLEEDDPRRVRLFNIWPALLEPEIADALDATEARLHENPLESPLPPGGNFPSQRKNSSSLSRSVVPRKYLLSGLIECAACGRRLHAGTRTYTNGHANMRYYWCRHASAQPALHPIRSKGGLGASFDADMVEWAVLRIVEAALRTIREATAAAIPAFRVEQPQTSPPRPVRLDKTEDLAVIERNIAKLFDWNERGIVTDADFKKRYDVLTARRAATMRQEEEQITPTALQQVPVVPAKFRADAEVCGEAVEVNSSENEASQVRALGTGRKSIRLAIPSDETIAAANLFLRNMISRIEIPVAVEGRTQRDELTQKRKAKVNPAYSYPMRYVCVHFREGLLPATSAISELRQMKFKRAIPEVVLD